MLQERLIRKAVEGYEQRWIMEEPEEKELRKRYKISEELEDRMRKLMEEERRPVYHKVNRVWKRVAVILVTLLVAAGTLCMGVEGIRAQIVEFLVETFEKYSQVTPKEEEGKREIEEVYEIKEMPEGYEKTKSETIGTMERQEYRRGEARLGLRQYPGAGMEIIADTEGAETAEEIEVGEHKGKYCETEKQNVLIWTQEGYIFKLTATELGREELVRIAEGIGPRE